MSETIVSKLGGFVCAKCNLRTVTAYRHKDGVIEYICSQCGNACCCEPIKGSSGKDARYNVRKGRRS